MGKYDAAPTLASGLIRSARDKADLTQSELAVMAGITQQAISAYETGRKQPTLPTLSGILRAAGFEMRIHLTPVDSHDETMQTFMEALPAATRARVDSEQRDRAAAARLKRVRGN